MALAGWDRLYGIGVFSGDERGGAAARCRGDPARGSVHDSGACVLIVSDERVAAFVSERLGFGLCPPFTAMGLERDGEIVAGALFNHFEGADVHVGIVGTGWTREFIRAVGAYVYGQLGCERMTAITADPAVAAYAVRLGGEIEGRLRSHFGPGKDAIVAGILRSEWRFPITP